MILPNEKIRLKQAMQKGEEIAKVYGFTTLPIDPFKIAEAAEIMVKEKPNTAGGVSGMLVRNGDNFGIMYATHVESTGFQYFSIAHELGHYFLDGHIDHVLPFGQDFHTSHAGYTSNDIYEKEADSFAAGLLMPSTLFKKALGGFKDGMEGVIGMAELCGTSLTATAIRYVQSTPCAAAAIVSIGNHVEYAFLSSTLQEARNIEWLKRGDILPTDCLTSDFNNDTRKVIAANRQRGKTDLSDWFKGVSAEGWEEIIGLGNYGKTLTVVSCSNYPEEEEIEEEERIEASLTPRFHR
jgi:Zn-dependent peptidase ImmA (M78 family)